MSKPLIVKNTIAIDADPAKVWDALTNPEQTRKYMFGCETVSSWAKGTPLLWRGMYEGKEMVFVKGLIVDIDPPRRLVYTAFDPNTTMEDVPQNHLTVTYSLDDQQGSTTLTVTQGDFSTVAEGERRYKDAYNGGEGWNPILVEIKKLVESPQ